MMLKIGDKWLNLLDVSLIDEEIPGGYAVYLNNQQNFFVLKNHNITADQLAEKINQYRSQVLQQSRMQIRCDRSGRPLS
jgi:hypothetical protein